MAWIKTVLTLSPRPVVFTLNAFPQPRRPWLMSAVSVGCPRYGSYDWHHVNRGQGCIQHPTMHKRAHPQQAIIWSQMPTMRRPRKPKSDNDWVMYSAHVCETKLVCVCVLYFPAFLLPGCSVQYSEFSVEVSNYDYRSIFPVSSLFPLILMIYHEVCSTAVSPPDVPKRAEHWQDAAL